MKSILITLSFVFVALNSFSQDVMVKQDGSKLEVKVLEITPENIKYKKWSNQAGPDYIINRSDVLVILYKNGETEVINVIPSTSVSPRKQDVKYNKKTYGQNMVNFNILHLCLRTVTFSYERFNEQGTRSFKIPLMFGYGPLNGVFLTGLETKFYPSKKRDDVKYFLGPAILLGRYRDIDYYGSNYYEMIFSSLFNNGVSLQLIDNLNITFDAALGGAMLGGNIIPAFQIGISFGYRF